MQHEDAIARSIQVILRTVKGERRLRPEFGCGISEVVFSPINATTIGLIRHYVFEALGWWEPRITVEDVAVEPSEDDPGLVLVSIAYTVKATNDRRNLVYPFYILPGEGEEPA